MEWIRFSFGTSIEAEKFKSEFDMLTVPTFTGYNSALFRPKNPVGTEKVFFLCFNTVVRDDLSPLWKFRPSMDLKPPPKDQVEFIDGSIHIYQL